MNRSKITNRKQPFFTVYSWCVESRTYKLKQKCIFPKSSNATSKAQNEHNPSNHHEEPHRVKAPQVGDGRDVGQDPLERTGQHTGCESSS